MSLFSYFFGRFSKDIGIDLGTVNTVVFVRGKGIVLREPSVIAFDKSTQKVMAIGEAAREMVGRTPGNIIAVRPMKDGVIADFDMTQMMISTFIKRVTHKNTFIKPKVLIGVPWGITAVEKRAVLDASQNAGAKSTYLIEEPMASAVGANLAVQEPRGRMVVDIGGGTTEVAVISLGGIVECKSIRIAGNEFDEAIMNYLRKNYEILIGERTAEQIKIDIGSAYPVGAEQSTTVKGRDLRTGLPKTFEITSTEIRDALSEALNTIIDTVRLALEKTPPELSSDIMSDGVLLTGGGSMLKGLDKLLSEETGLKIRWAEDPLSCVALGTGKLLEEIDTLRSVHYTNRLLP